MKIFQNRAFALILAIVVFLGAPLLSARVKLSAKTRETEAMFFEKEGNIDSPYYFVNERISAASLVCQTLSAYPECEGDIARVRSARNALAAAYDEKDISGMASANAELESAAHDLKETAGTVAMSTDDAGNYEYYVSRLDGAQRMLDRSGYNEKVRAARKSYDSFPGSMLSSLTGVRPPALFE